MAQSHETSPTQTSAHLPSKDRNEPIRADNNTTVEYLLKCIKECLNTITVEKEAYKYTNSFDNRKIGGRYN